MPGLFIQSHNLHTHTHTHTHTRTLQPLTRLRLAQNVGDKHGEMEAMFAVVAAPA